jgi:hypothetical protein
MFAPMQRLAGDRLTDVQSESRLGVSGGLEGEAKASWFGETICASCDQLGSNLQESAHKSSAPIVKHDDSKDRSKNAHPTTLV